MRFLKVLRALLKVGQRELASKAGMSVRQLVRIEAGEAFPSRGMLLNIDRAIAQILVERARG